MTRLAITMQYPHRQRRVQPRPSVVIPQPHELMLTLGSLTSERKVCPTQFCATYSRFALLRLTS